MGPRAIRNIALVGERESVAKRGETREKARLDASCVSGFVGKLEHCSISFKMRSGLLAFVLLAAVVAVQATRVNIEGIDEPLSAGSWTNTKERPSLLEMSEERTLIFALWGENRDQLEDLFWRVSDPR